MICPIYGCSIPAGEPSQDVESLEENDFFEFLPILQASLKSFAF